MKKGVFTTVAKRIVFILLQLLVLVEIVIRNPRKFISEIKLSFHKMLLISVFGKRK